MTEAEEQRPAVPYEIRFSEAAWKELWTLPKQTIVEIVEKIYGLAELMELTPLNHISTLSRLKGPWKSYLSVDNFWVMYAVNPKIKLIDILGIMNQPHDSDSFDQHL